MRFPIDESFQPDRPMDDDGFEYGFNQSDLLHAVRVWYYCQDRSPITVGEAAAAFHVTPGFLAALIEEAENPYFYTVGGVRDPALRVIEVDGD